MWGYKLNILRYLYKVLVCINKANSNVLVTTRISDPNYYLLRDLIHERLSYSLNRFEKLVEFD